MSSGFISETELAERRKVRQEEWEKVRKPDQPKEAPEEEYDHRSLYERLQEQKQKRDLEYEEAHRLKNMIKGLDDDEVEFLDLVDRSKEEEERKKTLEEEREMAEFRNKVASLNEKSLEMRIQQEIRRPHVSKPGQVSTGHSNQSKLLAGAVVKKRSGSELSSRGECSDKNPSKRVREESTSDCQSESTSKNSNADGNCDKDGKADSNHQNGPSTITLNGELPRLGAMTCIGVLPGLGCYAVDSSDEFDSECSSDPEDHLRGSSAIALSSGAAVAAAAAAVAAEHPNNPALHLTSKKLRKKKQSGI